MWRVWEADLVVELMVTCHPRCHFRLGHNVSTIYQTQYQINSTYMLINVAGKWNMLHFSSWKWRKHTGTTCNCVHILFVLMCVWTGVSEGKKVVSFSRELQCWWNFQVWSASSRFYEANSSCNIQLIQHSAVQAWEFSFKKGFSYSSNVCIFIFIFSQFGGHFRHF